MKVGNLFLRLVCGVMAVTVIASQAAHAAFVNPGSWTVGSANTTSQTWLANPSLGLPAGYVQNNLSTNSNPATTTPTLSQTGGFNASSGGYYSFSGNYQTTATIDNQAGGASMGTHVIVQYASTATDPSYFQTGSLGTSIGVLRDSIQLVDSSNNPLTGGAIPLAFEQRFYDPAYNSSFGVVPYEELIFEFFLPNYTGDFKVLGTNLIHSSFQGLRVDTAMSSAPFALSATAVPEPGTWALAGLAAAGAWGWRKRHRQS